jgi:hypothetical protein
MSLRETDLDPSTSASAADQQADKEHDHGFAPDIRSRAALGLTFVGIRLTGTPDLHCRRRRRQRASGTFFREAAHDAEDRCEGWRDRWLLGSRRFTAPLNLAGV